MTMTKKTKVFVAGSAALALSVGVVCTAAASQDANEPATASDTALAPASALEQDSASSTAASNPAPGEVVGVMHSEASMPVGYETTAKLNSARGIVAIVRGTITSIDYDFQSDTPGSGDAFTKMTVKVEKAFKGFKKTTAPATVTIWEQGGYAKVRDVVADNSDKGFPATYSAAELDKYIEYRLEDADHPKVGDTHIFYLMANPNPAQPNSYREPAGPYGRFKLDRAAKTYSRAARAGWESATPSTELDSELNAVAQDQ